MSYIEDEPTESVIEMRDVALDGGPDFEGTLHALNHELARRRKLGDTTLLTIESQNNPTGVIDALADTEGMINPPEPTTKWHVGYTV